MLKLTTLVPHRGRSRFAQCAVLSAALVALTTIPAQSAEDLLLPVKGKDGKSSPLFQKVVVTSDYAKLCKQGPGCDGGDPVEPYSIFYKLKTPAGAEEQDGWVRVGDSKGNAIGWIQRTNAKGEAVLKDWATRFVLEPNEPAADREFRVKTDKGTLKLNVVPAGKRRFAFITSASDAKGANEADYDVFVCTASVQSERGALATEARKLENLQLEVVFVVESTDFMLNEFDGMKIGDAVREVMESCVREIDSDPKLKDAARLGVVEFQDTSPKANFKTPRVTCKLTSDMSTVRRSLSALAPAAIEGDFPEDVLGGLRVAIDEAGWQPDSCKHVVLLGFGSAQLYPRGQSQGNFPGRNNDVSRRAPPPEDRGWNSSDLSIQQLIDRANPQGGSADDKARAQKTFHAIRVGKEVRQELIDQLQAKIPNIAELLDFAAENVRGVVDSNDSTFQSALERAAAQLSARSGNDEFAMVLVKVGVGLVADDIHTQLALNQYRQIAGNDDVQGLFEAVPPKGAELKRVAATLKNSLAEAFDALAKIRDRTIDSAEDLQGAGAFAQTFYSVVGANAERFKPQSVEVGLARTTQPDAKGDPREVAKRKVMVGRDELQKLKARLDAIHQIFVKKVAKKDRQSVSDTLDELKQAIAGAAAGQIVATTNLQDVITDLPLTTDVLRITPEQIATFSSDRFKAWLDGLKRSIDRAQTLLDRKDNWLPLSSLATADEVSFLLLTELP